MALPRPLVNVYDAKDPSGPKLATVLMPTVMQTPIRPDLVSFVHYNMMRNSRQAYGVKENAGYQTSAESWGTGRAVSRIPRVPGGGTHRAGQGAFGNMCRGGGMFAPNKTWRLWHRHINVTQKRHALSSAIAGSSFTGLVMGRGHRIEEVPELPLVVSDEAQSIQKTKEAVAFMSKIGCGPELEKVEASRKVRTGRGKARNRRYVSRKGPLLVYANDSGLTKAFANITGVDTAHVDRLNLLHLAPGGTLGRLVIWTQSAFQRLQELYGDYTTGSPLKSGYMMQRPVMTNADLGRIINSNEIQSHVRDAIEGQFKAPKRRNLLKNRAARCKVDPAYKFRQ